MDKTKIVERGFSLPKKMMISLLAPVLHEVGQKELDDIVVLNKLDALLSIVRPKISEEDIVEQMVFAVVAIKKHGISIGEAHKLILDVKAIEFCFEKYSDSGALDDMFFGDNDPGIIH